VRLSHGRVVYANGYAYFDDNHFCLLPGEQRTVLVDWHNVALQARCVSIGAWNTEPLQIMNEDTSGSAVGPEQMIADTHLR
jgi:hypothetical protein